LAREDRYHEESLSCCPLLRWRILGRSRSGFVALLNLLLDQVFQGITVFVGHSVDEFSARLHLGFSDRFFARDLNLNREL
jgi:hypothetical protein